MEFRPPLMVGDWNMPSKHGGTTLTPSLCLEVSAFVLRFAALSYWWFQGCAAIGADDVEYG